MTNAAQKKFFFWPGELVYKLASPRQAYTNDLLRQKTGGACLYMPQDGHWLARFEIIPLPKKCEFFRGQNMKISKDAQPLSKKISQTHFFLFLSSSFGCFCRKLQILSRRSRLSRTTSDPADRSGKFQAKMRFFCFSGEDFGTILSRRSRLSRTSRAPSRLIGPRSIDCDREPEQTVKTGFWPFSFSNI